MSCSGQGGRRRVSEEGGRGLQNAKEAGTVLQPLVMREVGAGNVAGAAMDNYARLERGFCVHARHFVLHCVEGVDVSIPRRAKCEPFYLLGRVTVSMRGWSFTGCFMPDAEMWACFIDKSSVKCGTV